MTTYDTSKVRVTLDGEPLRDNLEAARHLIAQTPREIGTTGGTIQVERDLPAKDRRAQKRRSGRKAPPPSVRQMVERAEQETCKTQDV